MKIQVINYVAFQEEIEVSDILSIRETYLGDNSHISFWEIKVVDRNTVAEGLIPTKFIKTDKTCAMQVDRLWKVYLEGRKAATEDRK